MRGKDSDRADEVVVVVVVVSPSLLAILVLLLVLKAGKVRPLALVCPMQQCSSSCVGVG
jgi:hypothetical protein